MSSRQSDINVKRFSPYEDGKDRGVMHVVVLLFLPRQSVLEGGTAGGARRRVLKRHTV